MSRSSYTASERRGVLAIAVIALLIMGFGAGFSYCSSKADGARELPMVIEQPEMIDTVAAKKQQNKLKQNKKETSKNKSGKKKGSKTDKSKSPKTYRQRSPLDEPV